MNYALIFAGGSGQRMKTNGLPKQFLKIEGKEIIIHTISIFENHPEIDEICVVCIDGWIEHLSELLKKHNIKKVKWIVTGGSSGQESIYNGLATLPCKTNMDTVLIHDGVRPFITHELISQCLNSIKKSGNAISVTGAIETIVTLDNTQERVSNILNRSSCFHAKAPQGFLLNEIVKIHNRAKRDNKMDFIDSASLMQAYGYQLYVVECGPENIKITTPADYFIAKALFSELENKQAFGV